MWSVPPRFSGIMWSMVKLRIGNSLRQPLHRPSCCPNRTYLFCRYSTGASMSVRLGMSVPAVTSRLWKQVAHGDCYRRMLTSSTALGEISMPIQRRPELSAATQAVAQPQAEEGQPKGAGPEKSPALLPNESARPA